MPGTTTLCVISDETVNGLYGKSRSATLWKMRAFAPFYIPLPRENAPKFGNLRQNIGFSSGKRPYPLRRNSGPWRWGNRRLGGLCGCNLSEEFPLYRFQPPCWRRWILLVGGKPDWTWLPAKIWWAHFGNPLW